MKKDGSKQANRGCKGTKVVKRGEGMKVALKGLSVLYETNFCSNNRRTYLRGSLTHLVQVLPFFAEDRVEAEEVLELPAVSLVVVKLAAQGFVLLQSVHDLLHHVPLGFFPLQELGVASNVLLAVALIFHENIKKRIRNEIKGGDNEGEK